VVDNRKQHVLFVCASNVFRSKLAEQAMRDSSGDRLIVRSAGILRRPAGARAENLQEPEAARILRAHGVKLPIGPCHRAEWRDLEWADHVLVMESWMKKILAERYPKFGSKVELLRGFARMRGNLNIADDDPEAGEVTEKRVMTACRQVYAAVSRIKQLNLL
jgi:protein-tyrosine-phosphatase